MTETAGWFEVDKDGLSKLLRRKSLSFVLNELLQNSYDTSATEVHVELVSVPNRPVVKLRVQDNDPDGFKFLSHGYVLFAESEKKGDPTKRGRFNLGEKLVLAACETAKLASTTGTIYFERGSTKGLTRRETRERLAEGSVFEAEIKMTRSELSEVLEASNLLLPPIPTTINGKPLGCIQPVRIFEAQLPTEISDEEGYLKRTIRKTTVRLYPQKDGASHLYEMGIPVVEIDLPWSVEVMQKVPLNADRDNVTPAYRKSLGVLVLNEMHQELRPEHAALPVIKEALESPDVAVEAVNTVLTHQYGKKRAVFDPSDPEANSKAFANGFNVIPGGAFSKETWNNIRRASAAVPAGKLFPTPQPYSLDVDPAQIIPESEWPDGIRAVAKYAKALAVKLMGVQIQITMEKERSQPYGANYGFRHLTFNAPKLGKAWFNLASNAESVNNLLIHEFGHEYGSNHLDEQYHKALTKLGAKLAQLALTQPEFFREHGLI
jgi:hypothetical protein